MSRCFRAMIIFLAVLLFLSGVSFAEGGSGFDYRVLDDGNAMITGYRGSGPEIVFPESIDGYTVSGLGESFGTITASIKNIKSITVPDTMTLIEPGALRFAEYLAEINVSENHPSLVFRDGVLYDRKTQSLLLYLQTNREEQFEVPEGIREIADNAFVRARRLKSVSLPGSVERIGRESFYQCTALEEISLSEGLKTIDADAFTNSDRLRTVEIPASVTDIAESAFTDAHLKEIRVNPDNPVFTVSDGALINIRDEVLLAFPQYSEAKSCTVPEGVNRIGSLAFYRCHNLKQIILPDGLLEIGHGAFLSCNHLTAMDIPDSVTTLEDDAFSENSDLEELHIPAGLTEIVNNFGGSAVSKLEIPETVTVIERSFYALPNLTEVVIPDSVILISNNSFAFCKILASVTIPAGVAEIRCDFIGCADSLVIRVEPGSYAEQYCRDHNLRFESISE